MSMDLKIDLLRTGSGFTSYTYQHFQLYREDATDMWQIADDGGWYRGVYPSAEAAVEATKDMENW